MRIGVVLLSAFMILSCAAWLRPPEYDEAYTIFLTAGDARPAWPDNVFRPGSARGFYAGESSPGQIARDLRKGDVHPPLYFWLLEYWRRLFGPGWWAARMLSVVLSVGGLAALGWLATLVEIPPSRAMLIALLSYGFAYTGIVARGFALAQALNILGMALAVSATRYRVRARRLGLAAGLAFGAAAFSNYLAVFVGLAAFLWLSLNPYRRRALPPAVLGFALFLPAILDFFMAQRQARSGQFQAFSWGPAMARLAKDFGAALYGGLPVYAGHAGGVVAFALLLFTVLCTAFIVLNWQDKLAPFALAALCVPVGLLALGLTFNNIPIEIRYLAFALPWLALVFAQTLPPLPRYLLLGIEACGLLGLIFAPATMQPQELAARRLVHLQNPTALVLLPFGNDGVGIPGPFIAAAPDDLRLELIKPNTMLDLSKEDQIVLVAIRADAASQAASDHFLVMLHADPCWRAQPATQIPDSFVRVCKSN